MRWTAAKLCILGLALAAASCGGGNEEKQVVDRLVHQVMTDAVGTTTQSWDYAYDSQGRVTGLRGYGATGALSSVATYTYSGNLRTLTTTVDGAGALSGTVEYTYVNGVLASSVRKYGTGAVQEKATYVFSGGKKLSTTRYTAADALIGHTDFHYAPTGERTGSTTYDASDVVTGSSARTYAGGLFTDVEVVSGATTTYRHFTFAKGPLVVDYDVFFEY